MAENIIIPDPEKLARVKNNISNEGPERFHVLADFDGTLIKAIVGGKRVPSMLSVLRDEGYLTPDYSEKAKALFNKYHAIEINSDVPEEEKKRAMLEWWTKHFKLLIESGLNKKDIEKAITSSRIQLREGAEKLLAFLAEMNIPLVIMSSSGLGGQATQMFLEKEECFYQNIYIISNSFEWDEKGRAIAVKEPIIHGMNKSETMVRNFPIFEKIKNKKNVLLMSDSLGDVGMIDGFEYDNLIKIGFLDDNGAGGRLESFKRAFDAVVLNDGSVDFVLNLLRKLF